jgi:hypothetical protein
MMLPGNWRLEGGGRESPPQQLYLFTDISKINLPHAFISRGFRYYFICN